MATTNFEPAKPNWCVINTINEMNNVFIDTGVMLYFDAAIHNEDIAVDVVESIINKMINQPTQK